MTYEQIAEMSKTATGRNPLYIYYNYKTNEIEIDPNKDNFKITGLIRENTVNEIKSAIRRYMSM